MIQINAAEAVPATIAIRYEYDGVHRLSAEMK
jgi:hypothetical protein